MVFAIVGVLRVVAIETGAMRDGSVFTLTDLGSRSGEVVDAAHKGPVKLTKHGRPKFVLMTLDDFETMRGRADPRRVYRTDEAPQDVIDTFLPGIEALAGGEGYDD